MSVVIIGGDRLGSIPKKLRLAGFDEIYRVSGRKRRKAQESCLPKDIDLVLVLTDYLNHNLMDTVKQEAKDRNIRLIFARRSWSSIYKKIDRFLCN